MPSSSARAGFLRVGGILVLTSSIPIKSICIESIPIESIPTMNTLLMKTFSGLDAGHVAHYIAEQEVIALQG